MNNSATTAERSADAFAEDWAAIEPVIRARAQKSFKNTEDINDAVQSVAAAAWAGYAGLHNREAFTVWAERIANDTVLPRVAKKKRTIGRREIVPDSPLEDFGSVKRYGFHKREFHLDYQAALAVLPEHICTIWLRYHDGESLSDIARSLDLSIRHTRDLCVSAQARLRIELAGYERSA